MLGAAYQAKFGSSETKTTFSEILSVLPPPELVCEPFKDAADIYDPMVKRCRNIISMIIKKDPKKQQKDDSSSISYCKKVSS